MTKYANLERQPDGNPRAERGVSIAGLKAAVGSRKSVARSSEHTSFQPYYTPVMEYKY